MCTSSLALLIRKTELYVNLAKSNVLIVVGLSLWIANKLVGMPFFLAVHAAVAALKALQDGAPVSWPPVFPPLSLAGFLSFYFRSCGWTTKQNFGVPRENGGLVQYWFTSGHTGEDREKTTLPWLNMDSFLPNGRPSSDSVHVMRAPYHSFLGGGLCTIGTCS